MDVASFRDYTAATARAVAAGTGIDPMVLQAQWANETAWGALIVGNNLGNIRCSPTTFCRYATLADFAAACIQVFHNGLYEPVLAAVTSAQQLAAIVASPWSAGHYGGSLDSFYNALEAVMDQSTFNSLVAGSPLANVLGTATSTYSAVLAAQKAILAAIQAIPPPAGGLTAAQAQALQEAHDAIQRIEAALRAA